MTIPGLYMVVCGCMMCYHPQMVGPGRSLAVVYQITPIGHGTFQVPRRGRSTSGVPVVQGTPSGAAGNTNEDMIATFALPKRLLDACWLVVWNIFFHDIWDNPSHWLIFLKMVKTTNQHDFKQSHLQLPGFSHHNHSCDHSGLSDFFVNVNSCQPLHRCFFQQVSFSELLPVIDLVSAQNCEHIFNHQS